MASEKILTLRLQVALAIAAFTVAFAFRVANAPTAFDHGQPQLSPIDELYHLKRITYTAAHFPHVLEFDADRGIGGAFCPWPPLYDLTFGGLARVLGATSRDDVLRRAVWFPPFFASLFVALTAVWLARRFGPWTAIAASLAIATSPFIVAQSAIGSIDHHWTEPFFVIAILAAAIDRRPILLGVAIAAAMFVQTALLVAAALAFVVVFGVRRPCRRFGPSRAAAWPPHSKGAIAFSIAAVAVALYRITRAPGYPDNQWFLGWTHAALFAGAAIACAYGWRPGFSPAGRAEARPPFFALLAGAAVVLAVPSAPASLLEGSHFFGGDRWLATIVEFQPVWRAHGASLLSISFGLGAGAILVWFLAVQAVRRRDTARIAVALFAIVYLLLTITSRRFWSVGMPLLAIAGALYATSIRRRVVAAIATAAVALIPPTQFVLWQTQPSPRVSVDQQRWIAAARFLHAQRPGRVLASWSYGHLIDVDGDRPVVIDNFGTMPDETNFLLAHDALLAKRDATLAGYCRSNGVRFVMLENPVNGLRTAAAVVGIDPDLYAAGGQVTRLGRSTWWWRAYAKRDTTAFRLIHDQPQVWELRDDVR